MKDIRVLHIAHDHPEFTPGGTEILAHGLARALDGAEGVTGAFLAATTSLTRPEDVPGSLGLQGEDYLLRTGRYDRFSMMRCDGTDWVDSLVRLLGHVRPQVVHLHGLDRIGAEVLAVLRRHAAQARIVLTLHDFQLLCPNDGLLTTVGEGRFCPGPEAHRCQGCFPEQGAVSHALRKAHLLALLRLVDQFIAPGDFLRDRFIAWGIEPGRIRVVPNAVAPLTGLRAREPVRPDRFAFFGNIAPHKGVLTLLAAAARLGDAELRIDLHGGLLHQGAEFTAAFAAALKAAPLAQHRGGYDRAGLGARISEADWIVVPSLWWENAPLVLLEARAAGKPVICSGIGGMAEMVADGVEGLHVPPGDAVALAEVIGRVAEDAGLHRRLSEGQRKRHSAGAYEGFVNEHLELYRSLTRRNAA